MPRSKEGQTLEFPTPLIKNESIESVIYFITWKILCNKMHYGNMDISFFWRIFRISRTEICVLQLLKIVN